jgi:hypothetical protein
MKKWIEGFLNEIRYPTNIHTGMSAASDHWPFVMQGVPAIYMHGERGVRQLIEGRGWGHTTADSMDKVDSRDLLEGATMMTRLLLRLATQKEKIAEFTPIKEVIENLEKTGMKKNLEIQMKWHPESPR